MRRLRVRLGFAGPSSHQAVGALSRAVRERYPLIDLEFRPGRYGASAVADLWSRTSDIVLACFTEAPPGVVSRVVATDRFVLAVPEGHRLAGSGPVWLTDLRDEPFVAFPESYGSAVRAILVTQCQALGFAPRLVQASSDTWTSIALVAAGAGLHFTSVSAVATLPLDGVRIVDVADPRPDVTVYLIWRADDESGALQRVLQTAEEILPTPGGECS